MKAKTTNDATYSRFAAWSVWLVAVIFVIYRFQTQSSYAVLNKSIAESLSLTLTQIGQLGAVYSITYALMNIIVGGLLDYYGARKVMVLGILIVSSSALAFSLSKGWYAILVCQCLLGVGGAVGFPSLGYVTRHWFSADKFGIVFGFAQTLAATANTIGQALAGYLILILTWQNIKLLESLAGFILLILAIIIIKEPNNNQLKVRQSQTKKTFWKTLFQDTKVLFKKTIFWQTVTICGLSFGVAISIGVVWGVRLLELKGFDGTTASNINSLIWIGFGIGALLIHVVADKINSYKQPAVGFLVINAMCLSYVLYQDVLSVLSATLLFLMIGFFTGVATLCYTMTTKFCYKNLSGTAFGYVGSITFLISSILIPIPGFLIENTHLDLSLNNSMAIYPTMILVAAVISLVQQETYRTQPDKSF